MPWLYYLEDKADQILSDTRITTEYTFPSLLKFKVSRKLPDEIQEESNRYHHQRLYWGLTYGGLIYWD